MSTVFIHAGMPKTGSTSVQEWLRRNAVTLREAHGLTPVVDHGAFDATPGLVPYERGPFVVSHRFLLSYYGGLEADVDAAELTALCDRLCDELRAAADAHGDVIITAEAFGRAIFSTEAPMLAAFESLSRHHTVRVIAYVRPQHDALESLWRQSGYHTAETPSIWFADQMPHLHYHRAIEAAATIAPSIHFELRPFRRDLLEGNDVVVDFADHLGRGVELSKSDDLNENPGLSLDLAILLRGAPREMLATPENRLVNGSPTGIRQVSLAAVTKDWNFPTSARAGAARDAIHSIARHAFAADNAELVEAQGWAIGDFIPPHAGPAAGLADLDELLLPTGDATTLSHFHRALADLCTAHEAEGPA